jgi:hypothetical protein
MRETLRRGIGLWPLERMVHFVPSRLISHLPAA